jgi:hypothetical protein
MGKRMATSPKPKIDPSLQKFAKELAEEIRVRAEALPPEERAKRHQQMVDTMAKRRAAKSRGGSSE